MNGRSRSGPSFSASRQGLHHVNRSERLRTLQARLDLLEDHGCICEASAPSTGGRRSVVYRVTPKGW